MIKKIISLLSICCVFSSINAGDFDYGPDNQTRKSVRSGDSANQKEPKTFQEAIPRGAAKSGAVIFTTGACLVMDVAMFDRDAVLKTLQPGLSRMIASGSVMFHDATEGPLFNEKSAYIIDKSFFILALIAMPEITIGTYASSYALDWVANCCGLDPMNKTTFKYWGARIGGILSQLAILAVFNYFTVTED